MTQLKSIDITSMQFQKDSQLLKSETKCQSDLHSQNKIFFSTFSFYF